MVQISKFCDLHGLRCIKWPLILVLFSLALGECLIFGQKVSVLSNRLAKPREGSQEACRRMGVWAYGVKRTRRALLPDGTYETHGTNVTDPLVP